MKITNGALAALVTNLLTNPHSGELDSMERFERFFNDLTTVVCDHCGGEIMTEASYVGMTNDDEFEAAYMLEVELNASSPEDGGIWSESSAVEVFAGHLIYKGTRIDVGFQAPVGATVAVTDAAFMASLAQQAEINYLAIGDSDRPLPESGEGWTKEDSKAAQSEGWDLFEASVEGNIVLLIERCDEKDTFEDDVEAIEFVKQQAVAGNSLAAKALRLDYECGAAA